MPESSQFNTTAKDYFKLLRKIALRSAMWLLIFAVIVALCKFLLLDLSHVMWNLNELQNQYEILVEELATNPDLILTSTQQQLKQFYPIQSFIVFSITFIFTIIPIFGTVLMIGRHAYILISEEDFGNESWKKSTFFPFQGIKQSLFSIFLIFIGSIVTFLGFLFLLIPAFIAFIFINFLIFTVVIDENIGVEAFKGSRFYLRGNFAQIFWKITFYFLGVLLLNLFIQPFIMNLMQFNYENYYLWLNPNQFQPFKVFIFDVLFYGLQIILFIPFPALITTIFLNSRNKSLTLLTNVSTKEKNHEKKDLQIEHSNQPQKIIEIKIHVQDTHFLCKICHQMLPVSSQKCFKCGQLYHINHNAPNQRDDEK